ncbi:Peroxiredoxin [Seinonella peptonophila]|uniref:Peroxiredoxin n=1 Tax=Seinonella peptonophila TaxID=112248 RepID=A0A1M4X859_9BACL|nr:redoxin domain-containing protein [Seinonella peptonophila]SHE89720.1 Peroxiredoxin [Seinonella peptonophila]
MGIQLQPGTIAPTFQCIDQNGKTISLENFRGKKVLLSFFRFAACALCNLHVHQLIQQYPNWQKQGLEVITFFESPQENIHAHVGSQQAPFALIADPKAEVYDRYYVETSVEKIESIMKDKEKVRSLTAKAEAAGFALTHEAGSNFYRLPAEFLINENGVIDIAHYNQSVEDHLSFEVINQYVNTNSI